MLLDVPLDQIRHGGGVVPPPLRLKLLPLLDQWIITTTDTGEHLLCRRSRVGHGPTLDATDGQTPLGLSLEPVSQDEGSSAVGRDPDAQTAYDGVVLDEGGGAWLEP